MARFLISLRIDGEPVVRSNCIWSLGRLYGMLNEEKSVFAFQKLVVKAIMKSTKNKKK